MTVTEEDPNARTPAPNRQVAADLPSWLEVRGEMAARIRRYDWNESPLGPLPEWPATLHTALSICLPAAFPMGLLWGKQHLHFYNDASIPLLGTRHPLLGRPARESWPELWETLEPIFRQVKAEGKSLTFMNQPVTLVRDGVEEEAYFTVSCAPLYTAAGDIGGIFVTALETTGQVATERRVQARVEAYDVAQKRAEAALRESQERLQAALDAAAIGTWRVDLETGLISRDASLNRILGQEERPTKTPLEDYFHNLIHPEDRAVVKAAWNRAVHQGEAYDVEHRIVHPDGKIRWLRDQGRIFADEAGKSLSVIGAVTDITSRKLAEVAFSRERELLHALFERIPVMVLMYNPHLQTIRANRAFEETLGWSTADLQEVDVMEVCYPDPDYRAEVRRFMERLDPGWRDFDVTARDGTVVTSSWTNVRLSDDTHIGIGLDVRQQRQAEAALRELNQSLEERIVRRTTQVRRLASTLTLAEQRERDRIAQILHDDLQQLLYALELRLGLIPRQPEEGHAALAEVRVLLDRAIEMVRTLVVDLSPPVLQGEGLEVAVKWLANQMADLHGLAVTVEADSPCSLPDQEVRVLLFQLVRELLFNVVKHADVAEAHVRLVCTPRRVSITVADAGRGFDLERAWLRHQQSGGLGLFTMRERLELLGGSLEIEAAPGVGAEITIKLDL